MFLLNGDLWNGLANFAAVLVFVSPFLGRLYVRLKAIEKQMHALEKAHNQAHPTNEVGSE